jgi:hypothetical protein
MASIYAFAFIPRATSRRLLASNASALPALRPTRKPKKKIEGDGICPLLQRLKYAHLYYQAHCTHTIRLFLRTDVNDLITIEPRTDASTIQLRVACQLLVDIEKAFAPPKTPPSTDLEILPVIRKTLERAKRKAEKEKNEGTNATVAATAKYVSAVEVVSLCEVNEVTEEVLEEVLERRNGDFFDGELHLRGQHTWEVVRKVMKRFEGRPVLKEDVLQCHRDIIISMEDWDEIVREYIEDELNRHGHSD